MMKKSKPHHHQINQSIDMLTRNKSRKVIPSRLKDKESGWNDRFFLNHIPEYHYQNDSPSKYIRHKFRLPHKKSGVGNEGHKNHFQVKQFVSNKGSSGKKDEKIKEIIMKTFEELKGLWEEKKIPDCHKEAKTKVFNRQYHLNSILEDIKKQHTEMKNDSSLIQKIMTAIDNREETLLKIIQVCQSASIKDFQQLISQFRILTIQCIQGIFQWKQDIQEVAPKPFSVNYITNGESYIKKIHTDYEKIIKAECLRRNYTFIKNRDIFFINYSKGGKKVSNISKNLMKRIKVCEGMIESENNNNLKKNISVRSIKLVIDSKKNAKKNYKILHSSINNEQEDEQPDQRYTGDAKWKLNSIQYHQFNSYYQHLIEDSPYKDSFLPKIDVNKFEEIAVLSHLNCEFAVAADRLASSRKIFILGFSCEREEIESCFENLLNENLWIYGNCEEVKIWLVHRRRENKYSVDSQLEKKLKSIGFRWSSINNQNDLRTTIYSIRRPSTHTTALFQNYLVCINHSIAYSQTQNNISHGDKSINHSYASVLDLLLHLQQNSQQTYNQSILKNQEMSSYINGIQRIKEYLEQQNKDGEENEIYFSYPGIKSFSITNPQSLQTIFQKLLIKPVVTSPLPSLITLLNTSFKYNHTWIQDENYTKLLDVQLLVMEAQGHSIYLLDSDEENINFFVVEVDDEFELSNLDQIFKGIQDQSSFKGSFWMPIFHKTHQYTDTTGMICSEVASTSYSSYLGSTKSRTNRGKIKRVKAPFVFGLIHKKLLEMVGLPLYFTLINKQDLL